MSLDTTKEDKDVTIPEKEEKDRREQEQEIQRQLLQAELPGRNLMLTEANVGLETGLAWVNKEEAPRQEEQREVPRPDLSTYLTLEQDEARHLLVGDWFRPEGDFLRPDLEKVEARSLTTSRLNTIAHELKDLGELIKDLFPILKAKNETTAPESYSRPAFHRPAVITAPTIASTTPDEVAEVSMELSSIKEEVRSEREDTQSSGAGFVAIRASLQYVNEALEDLSIVENQLGQKLKVSVDPDARSYLDSVARMKSDLEAVQRDLVLIGEIYAQLN